MSRRAASGVIVAVQWKPMARFTATPSIGESRLRFGHDGVVARQHDYWHAILGGGRQR
jgi:hypothetical protein